MSEKNILLKNGYKFDIAYYCNNKNCNTLSKYIEKNFKDCESFDMLEFGTCEGSSSFYFMKYFLPPASLAFIIPLFIIWKLY